VLLQLRGMLGQEMRRRLRASRKHGRGWLHYFCTLGRGLGAWLLMSYGPCWLSVRRHRRWRGCWESTGERLIRELLRHLLMTWR